jgi:hypothetical protein
MWTLEGAAEGGDTPLLRVWTTRRFCAFRARHTSKGTPSGLWTPEGVGQGVSTERYLRRARGRAPRRHQFSAASGVPSRCGAPGKSRPHRLWRSDVTMQGHPPEFRSPAHVARLASLTLDCSMQSVLIVPSTSRAEGGAYPRDHSARAHSAQAGRGPDRRRPVRAHGAVRSGAAGAQFAWSWRRRSACSAQPPIWLAERLT